MGLKWTRAQRANISGSALFKVQFNIKTLRGSNIHIRPKHFITPPEFGGLYYCYEVFVIGLAKPYLFPPHRNSR